MEAPSPLPSSLPARKHGRIPPGAKETLEQRSGGSSQTEPQPVPLSGLETGGGGPGPHRAVAWGCVPPPCPVALPPAQRRVTQLSLHPCRVPSQVGAPGPSPVPPPRGVRGRWVTGADRGAVRPEGGRESAPVGEPALGFVLHRPLSSRHLKAPFKPQQPCPLGHGLGQQGQETAGPAGPGPPSPA